MFATSTLKLKNIARRAHLPERRREEIDRKAAVVSRAWSTDERAQRAAIARQMQRRLFASIVGASQGLQSVA